MSEPAIEAAESRPALAAAAAAVIADQLRAALAARGKASFVATGGSTPAECYAVLARAALDWARVEITLSDERWVAVDSESSNERMLRATLLQGPAAAARFVSLKAKRGGAEEGAKAVERGVRPLAPFDLTLLGMGEDGHIASLFPGHPALAVGLDPNSGRFCIGVAPASPAPDLPRASLTLAALLQSRLIVLLITGEAKRVLVRKARGRPAQTVPVAALLEQNRAPLRILWAP